MTGQGAGNKSYTTFACCHCKNEANTFARPVVCYLLTWMTTVVMADAPVFLIATNIGGVLGRLQENL